MKTEITAGRPTDRGHKPSKVTCLTCQLKGCVGRCHFQKAAAPPHPKAA